MHIALSSGTSRLCHLHWRLAGGSWGCSRQLWWCWSGCWLCHSCPQSPASHLPLAPRNPHGGVPPCSAAGSGSQPGHGQQRLSGSNEWEALCCHLALAYDLRWKWHMPLVTPVLYRPHNQQEITGNYLKSTLVNQKWVARRQQSLSCPNIYIGSQPKHEGGSVTNTKWQQCTEHAVVFNHRYLTPKEITTNATRASNRVKCNQSTKSSPDHSDANVRKSFPKERYVCLQANI